MKNLLVAAFCVLPFLTFSQVTDTLGWSHYVNGDETLYESPNWGYAFGNNGYSDKAKAQTFVNDRACVLRRALLKFGAVNFASEDSSSAIVVNVYLNNGSGITVFSNNDTLAPDSIVASAIVPTYDLLEGGITEVDFGLETVVIGAGQSFSIGIRFDSLALGDTIGLLSTTDGDAGETYRAWELTSNDNWIVVAQAAYSWNLDVDLGIFAVIDDDDPASVSRAESATYDLRVFPNPATNVVWLESGSIKSWEKLNVELFNSMGQLVKRCNFPDGVRRLQIDDLEAGIYTVVAYSEYERFYGKLLKN